MPETAKDRADKLRNSAPQVFTYHRYGGTLGGPVLIPGIYNGRNKTFFFGSYEGILNYTPSSGVFTVPTVNERVGNFSGLATIYDQLGAVKEGTRIRPAGIAAGALHVPGGLTFAGKDNRLLWNPDNNNFQPRLGVAWQLTPKTVLRGGWGMYMVPWIGAGLQQAGFSQSTDVVTTLDGGLSFIGNLATPFPLGITAAAGAGGGLSTFVGQAITFAPLNRVNGLAQRWVFGIQRELPGNWKLEISYAGSKGYDLPVTVNLNATPRAYISTSATRDQPAIDYLGALIANPFRNLAPTQTTLGSATTIARSTLLRPFPQFSTITTERYDG